MRKIKKIGIIVAVGVCLLAVSGLAIVSIYEDDIKAYALAELGKQLKTEIKVDQVNLTLWEQFPLASLKFKDVFIKETFAEGDTLIFAESVFLNFSITDFISGNYVVKNIGVENSQINLKRLKSGEDNYHFWGESDEKGSEFALDLNKIDLVNAAISFDDKLTDLDLDLIANQTAVSGDVSSTLVNLSGKLDTYVNLLKVGEQEYIRNKTISGNAGISIDLKNSIYTFTEGNVAVNELPLEISGTVDLGGGNTTLDIRAVSKKAQLASVIKNLPDFVQAKMSSFTSDGLFQSDITIKGIASSKTKPTINGSFQLENGTLENNFSGIELENIWTSGNYSVSPGKEDLLSIENLTCDLGSGKFQAKGKVSRLTNPFINAEILGDVQLHTFQEFFNFPEIEKLEGNSKIALAYKGNFGKNWNPSASNLRAADISGRCSLDEASIKLTRNPHEIREISGELLLTKGDAAVNQLVGKVDKSDFKFDGFFRNLMPYLLVEDESLLVESSLESELLDFNGLLSSSESGSEEYEFNLPKKIHLNVSADITELKFRDFHATSVHAQVRLNNKQLRIEPISMSTSDGDFRAEIVATQQSFGDFKIQSTGNVNQVDVAALFQSFENFQQTFITDKHLKGSATCDYALELIMSNTLEVRSNSVDVKANLKLKNGELIQHEALAEIGQYMKDKKLVSALTNMNAFSDKLAHVRFSELTNEIIIKNEKISIPKMDIKSDALDIKAEGTHSFDNKIDYSIGFDLADLAAKNNYAEDEKGISKYVFVSMTGTSENPSFGYDQTAVKQQRKENRQEEKQKIKELLKEEFAAKQNTKPKDSETLYPKENVTVKWSETKKEEEEPKKEIKEENPFKKEEEDDYDDDF